MQSDTEVVPLAAYNISTYCLEKLFDTVDIVAVITNDGNDTFHNIGNIKFGITYIVSRLCGIFINFDAHITKT